MRPAVLMLLYLVTVIVAVAALVALCWALLDWAIQPLPYNDPEPRGTRAVEGVELLVGGSQRVVRAVRGVGPGQSPGNPGV